MILSELRKLCKVSMQELADDISVSKQLIGHIEKENRDISEEMLKKLVDYFQLNLITEKPREFLMKDTIDDVIALKIKRNMLMRELEKTDIEIELLT